MDDARRGDVRAFDRIAKVMRPKLVRYAYRLTGDRTLSEQVVQQALTKGLADIVYRPEGLHASAWLYQITHHQVVDELRKVKAAKTYSLEQRADHFVRRSDSEDGAPPWVDGTPVATGSLEAARDPSDIIEERDEDEHRRGRLTKVMEELPKELRVLLLDRANGLSYAEIGEKRGLDQQRVKSMLERARKLARAAYGAQEE